MAIDLNQLRIDATGLHGPNGQSLSVVRCASKVTLAEDAANLLAAYVQACVTARHRFSLALAGGSTPQELYRLLGSPVYAQRLPWDKTQLFWGDERAVSAEHRESNYGQARLLLIEPLGLSPAQVHPMPATQQSLDQAARAYEDTLRHVLGPAAITWRSKQASPPEVPTLDLVLLGMGADGHTASLFPGSPALAEERRLVVATTAPPGSAVTERLTVTLPLIAAARAVLFLITGAEKLAILDELRADLPAAAQRYPAAMVARRCPTVWVAAE